MEAGMLRPIGLTLALLSLAVPAAAQRTTREMHDLSAGEAKRVLRSDLVSILAMPGKVARGNRLQLHDTAIPTRPVGSGIEGLCQRDFIMLLYAPTRSSRAPPPGRRGLGDEPDRERLEDVPVRPYAVEAERRYFFTRVPRWESLDENHRFRSIFSENCSVSADSIVEGWFTAPSPRDAVTGYLSFEAAAAAVAAGRVPLSGCEEDGPEGLELCRADLARVAADPRSLGAIRACKAEPGCRCYALDWGTTVITLVIRNSDRAPSADDVISVAHESYVIVT
jgi:hypothetical protein